MATQQTKALLAASLKELSQFKSVDKITIRELTKNCGLTPPTFYNHFRDKYDLAAWICNRRVEAVVNQLGASLTFEEVLRRWMEILFEDEIFYRNALKNFVGQNSFRYATNDYAINLMRAHLAARYELSDELSCCLRFYMRAISETVNDWFLSRRELEPRELAKFLVEWMPPPLKPLLL